MNQHLRSILFVHALGSPFAREAVAGLSDHLLLDRVITAFHDDERSTCRRLLAHLPIPRAVRETIELQLRRRRWITDPDVQVTDYSWREIVRMLLEKSGARSVLFSSSQPLVDWVSVGVDAAAAEYVQRHDSLRAVYCFEDAALRTFDAASHSGAVKLYDLPIPYYATAHRIMGEEAERWPEFSEALQAAHEPAWKIERKARELQAADRIIVASSFSAQSVVDAGIDRKKVVIVPYGAPTVSPRSRSRRNAPFRVLFVGRVGPRKGVHYLLNAWKQFSAPDAELVLIGINEFPLSFLADLPAGVRYLPSLPHEMLHSYYLDADLFVFPSLLEGYGLVLLEAMACGLPIVTTPHTGAADFLEDNREGFFVPIRDSEAILSRLEWAYRHRAELEVMGVAAQERAEVLSWGRYRQQLVAEVTTALNGTYDAP